MGASCSIVSVIDEKERRIQLTKYYNSLQYFEVYLSIKNILINDIYNQKDISKKEVYLIEKKSIQLFIDKLNNAFNFLQEGYEEELKNVEEKIKEEFENYEHETPTFYSYYQQCEDKMKENIRNENQDKNDFVIADEIFIRNFEFKGAKFMSVNIINIQYKDNENYCINILFPASQKKINAREKKDKKGFFEFYEPKEKVEDKNKSNNILINEEDKNDREKERFKLMIKSICRCLISLGSFKNFFLVDGNKINKDTNKICKIFFDMIQENNRNDQLDCSKLIKDFPLANLYEAKKNIIEFIYTEIHKELINNNSSNNNNMIIKSKKSQISKIFFFQLGTAYRCQNCGEFSQDCVYSNIEFSLKNVFNYKKGPNGLNIFDCLDYVINICQKCSMKNNSFYKINPTSEILTFILNRGNDFKDNIQFTIDEKINLDKYFEEDNKDKYEFELIEYSSYYSDKNIFYTYYKNENENNNWYYYDGTSSKYFFNSSFHFP